MFYFKLYLTIVCFFSFQFFAMGRSKERVESESNGRTALEERGTAKVVCYNDGGGGVMNVM